VTAEAIVFTCGLLSLAFTIACSVLSAICRLMAGVYIRRRKFSAYSWLMLIRRYGAAAKHAGGGGAIWFHYFKVFERLAWMGIYSLALSVLAYVLLAAWLRFR
jgi:hypothetical protein